MNELKVGFLTLLAIVSLVVVSLKITSNRSGMGDYVKYRAILNDATGIYENSSIRVAGIVAGRIKSIDLAGTQAVVTFEVLESIKITAFSKLRIKTVGFLGDKYLDIYLGEESAQRLEPNQYVQVEGGAGFEEISKDASEVLKDIKKITEAIRESLYDEAQKNVVKEVMEDVRAFSRNAKDISQTLKRIVDTNEVKVNNMIAELEKMASQLSYETDRYADGSLMNDLETIKPILANVNDASSNLKIIMADVRSGKGTVGKLLRDEDVVDNVNQTLAGVNRIVNRINNFKTDLSLYSGYNTEFGARTDFNVDLIPGPERFFRLGLVMSDYGPTTENSSRTISSVDGGAETEVSRRKIDESKIKFNLQIGRKIGNWGLRAGLIENSGGVGFDYHIPHWGTSAFVEAFDYQKDAGPNLRTGVDFKLYNVLYARLMAEDIASQTDDQSYVIGVGLRFTDEDLAALIGAFAR